MGYEHWFVSRQKRQLTKILEALLAFSDVCVGKVWSGNHGLQLGYEDELGRRGIIEHGGLRARRVGQGGGGVRTLFKQLRDLGLVFVEEENQKCRLTLIGEALVAGNVNFVQAMRLQLKRYQYPSATCYADSGSVSHEFVVHPFQFMFRLLLDARLENHLTMQELYGIVIHYAKDETDATYEKVVRMILALRGTGAVEGFVPDDRTKTYSNIANTFCNYISLTQYVDRGVNTIGIRAGKEADVADFVQRIPFIPHPEEAEIYQRKYGRGYASKDLRVFDRDGDAPTRRQLMENRIRQEFILLRLKKPVLGITHDIVLEISDRTGIDERFVERFLVQNYPDNNADDFFLWYRELAFLGREHAIEFEEATAEVFKRIFGLRAEHLGGPNRPDVFVESAESGYCGIIDNKAYHKGYSISGAHKRVMEDVYVPNYKDYVETDCPLGFFSYLSGSFGSNINTQIAEMVRDTGIDGSAMSVDLFINMAQDYADSGRNHDFIKRVFSVNREVQLSDIQ